MKVIVESEKVSAGLAALLGENVLIMCANYFYTGKLAGVEQDHIELENPAIVYETGAWDEKAYMDVQEMHAKRWSIQIAAIESYGLSK